MQFIGELYMQNICTARIMHECVTKLLYASDEGSLECLCKLLFVIAEKLVPETISKLDQGPQFCINDISVYLQQMNKLAGQARFSLSLRMMIEDVILITENLLF